VRFTAEITFAARSRPGSLAGPVITELAREAERLGFDAISFNEHPIPGVNWLESGGHDAHDPATVHSWCAAVTERLRVIPYLVVLPYRDPLLLAKTFASLDVLSQGRAVMSVGTGYLRSEFAALGIPFEERNQRFDEAIEVIRAVWRESDGLTYSGRFTELRRQVATPAPAQGRVPIWIGGNGQVARDRVARFGDGWAPLVGVEAAMLTTVRTPALHSVEDFQVAVEDLRRRCEGYGRDPADLEIQAGGGPCAEGGTDVQSHLDHVAQLERAGATQNVVDFQVGGDRDGLAELQRFGEQVVQPYLGGRVAG
jgi:probable F420-dependent oxidoreductase